MILLYMVVSMSLTLLDKWLITGEMALIMSLTFVHRTFAPVPAV